MKIRSAQFVKGVVGTDEIFEDGTPQIAFIGRSNVGKSSVINSLVGQKNLARTSSSPGSTREINVFLINKSFYLVDLPGYGFAKGSREARNQIQRMIQWYLFESGYEQRKVVLIIDAEVGPTETDMETLRAFEAHEKDVVIVANKIDKIKKSLYDRQFKKIQDIVGAYPVIAYSAEKKIGVGELAEELLKG